MDLKIKGNDFMAFYPLTQTLSTYETASPTTPSSSMTQNLISSSFSISGANQFLAQAFWSGTPTGTISVVGSQDNVNFNIPIYSISTGGSTGSLSYDLFGTSVMWIQIQYTFSSGTGTLTCSASSKVG